MAIKHTYLSLLILLFLSSTTIVDTPNEIKCITTQKTFEAGEFIELLFSTTQNTFPGLYCSHTYGSTIITPIFKNNVLYYEIPSNIGNKAGIIHWKLLESPLYGQFTITPKTNVTTLETYIGPPSIAAGGSDFSMMVVIPTDALDNPLKDGTQVNIKHQFLSSEENNEILTEHLISYKNIYSKKETGRILITSECLNEHSKEYDINVLAAIPTNFSISAKRHHVYADGNQVTTFVTSILKDEFDNVVNDGTFVDFFITNEVGNILKTNGSTIKGIATATMIHPDHKSRWTIKAFVNGMAESNVITLDYTQVITDFDVAVSKDNNMLIIGPLQSFMKQMIPDGLQVTLSIYKENIHIYTSTKGSRLGFAHFNLKDLALKKGNYNFNIKTAGLEKTLQFTKL